VLVPLFFAAKEIDLFVAAKQTAYLQNGKAVSKEPAGYLPSLFQPIHTWRNNMKTLVSLFALLALA